MSLTARRGLVYNCGMSANRRKMMTIGVAVTRDSKSHRDKLSGVLRYAAAKANWNVLILDGVRRPPLRPDAMIVLIRGALKALAPDLPAVTVDQFCAANRRRPNVFVDNRQIGRTVAELFIRRGYTNLAAVRHAVGGDAAHSDLRIRAFAAAARKSGLPVSVYAPVSATESQFLCGSDRFLDWLRDLPKPCGVFCFCDSQSRDVLDCCRRARLSVPDQVSLVGVDNEADVCEATRPTLSSVQPDFEAAGYCAAKALDGLLSGRKVRETYSYGILRTVERESSQPVNAAGRIVSAAMRLIRADDAAPSVADIARQLHISTTFLNRRFNEILGHGPKEEICRRRIAQISDLLRDPSLTVTEIAERCRFAYPEELHLFFRRRTGLTPTQWRRSWQKQPSNPQS